MAGSNYLEIAKERDPSKETAERSIQCRSDRDFAKLLAVTECGGMEERSLDVG